MLKNLFKKFEEDDDDNSEVKEHVDPVLEKRRKEKFSQPLIYDDEFKEQILQTQKVESQTSQPVKEFVEKKPVEKKPVEKKSIIKEKIETKPTYQMSEVISPITGKKGGHKTSKVAPARPKILKKRNSANDLIPVISPFYGNFDEKEDIESESMIQHVDEDVNDINEDVKDVVVEQKVPTVEDNLRNIANIVKKEQDELKIIEERTGEFKLDFSEKEKKEENTLIDEIDDNMSLDELMNLYEKKFKD